MSQGLHGGEATPPGCIPALMSPPLPSLPLHQDSALHCTATMTKTVTMTRETGALSYEFLLLKKSGPLSLKEEEIHTAQGRTSMLLNLQKATTPLLQSAPLQWLYPMCRGKK